MAKTPSVRLPTHFTPTRYTLTLKPDLQNKVFEGREVITYILDKPVDTITLHADELAITSVGMENGEVEICAKTITFNKKAQTVTFTFPEQLPQGHGTLTVIFSGVLNDKMRGFYASSYEVDGKPHTMATTQFESTDARRAFPCVDEPGVKAIFDVTLIVPKDHVAISNTFPTETRPHDQHNQIVSFAPSPKMSTYLLAFVIGKFEWIEEKTSTGTLVRVFVTPGKKSQAEFALQVAVKSLTFFEKYFKIKYPLPVLDMIAVPDFSAGAMENWGAITYRETALLFDKDKTSTTAKQYIAIVIAHEIAHQWFGNLVTMEWWTHLWLNEGFASFISYLAVDHIFPTWDIWTQFVKDEMNRGLNLDALHHTHPIEVEVHHPSEISEIFDAISYSKGAAIIRMLAEYIGEKNFREGLHQYLKKHSYSNAATEDLWNAFEKVSGKPIQKIMHEWTAAPGFPVVDAVQTPQGLRVSQTRFYSSAAMQKRSKDKTLWQIPITIRTGAGKKHTHMLLTKKSALLQESASATWLNINAGTTGYYRTNYSPEMLIELEKGIRSKELKPVERLSVQDDAFALAEAAQGETVQALHVARAYINETDFTVWHSLVTNLLKVHALLAGTPHQAPYKKFVRTILSVRAEKLGWQPKKNELHTDKMLRSLLLRGLGAVDDQKTLTEAKAWFKKIKAGKKVDADLRGVIYALTARQGDAAEYAWMQKQHDKEKLQAEKTALLNALGLFKGASFIKKTLDFACSKSVRPQDTYLAFVSAWQNPSGYETVWEYTTKNWAELVEKFAGGGHLLPRFIAPASRMHTKEDFVKVKKFFQKNKAPGCERTIQQALESIESNAAWRARDSKAIGEWLKKNA